MGCDGAKMMITGWEIIEEAMRGGWMRCLAI